MEVRCPHTWISSVRDELRASSLAAGSGAGVAKLVNAVVSQITGLPPLWVRIPPPAPTALDSAAEPVVWCKHLRDHRGVCFRRTGRPGQTGLLVIYRDRSPLPKGEGTGVRHNSGGSASPASPPAPLPSGELRDHPARFGEGEAH